MSRLRVGLVGAGMVAQTVHVPVLKSLGDRFEIAAICDISDGLAGRVAGSAGAAAYTDHLEMLEKEALDLVAVVNSDEYHADCAVDALAAGCHVLVEKPVALNVADTTRIIQARDAAGTVAMVGYMRRFAGAYRRMRQELATDESILHVAVRDIIGPNSYFLDQTTWVDSADDIPAAARDEREARAKAQVAMAIGDAPAAHVSAYRLLCGLGSHDLGALQGLVGNPRRVVGAAQKANGHWVTAILDYGDFLGTFEMGLDQVGDFDAYIEIFTGKRRLRIDYDTPFIKHLPVVLSVKSTDGEDLRILSDRPSYRDPYTQQWIELHAAVTAGGPVEATLDNAAKDQQLFADIVAAFPD